MRSSFLEAVLAGAERSRSSTGVAEPTTPAPHGARPARVRRRLPRPRSSGRCCGAGGASGLVSSAGWPGRTPSPTRGAWRRDGPRAIFDYVDGGAEQEIGIDRARAMYRSLEFRPRVLRDVSTVDLSGAVLGERARLPLVLAPTGFTRMMHHSGEVAVARAAAGAGVPYALSTMGTTSAEEVAGVEPPGRRWFQLYLWKDRAASAELLARVEAAGYDTVVLTVDTPVGGARLRDVRNGLTIPPALTLRTLAGMAVHPGWWFNALTTEPLRFAAMSSWDGTVEELVDAMFDPSVGHQDLTWLRERWPGKLVVKGVQHVDDARDIVARGADAVVVSTHGGRQLDRAPTPLELLPEIVAAVDGRAEVMVDTGITTGADLVAVKALGASAGMIGRGYLYGLMAGGERGVARVLEILAAEAGRTLQLLGVARMEDLGPDHVRLRPPA